MKLFLLLILAQLNISLPPNFQALTRRLKIKPSRSLYRFTDGKLNSIESVFMKETALVTIPFLKMRIVDTHANMKLCILDRMKEDNTDHQIDFNLIVENCVGANFSILIRFFEEVNAYIREITKNNLKCQLSIGLCKRRIDQCLEYLEVISDFIDMDYDMTESIQSTRNSLGRRFGKHFYDKLINITEKQLDEYTLVNHLLRNEKEFFEEFLHQQYVEYTDRHSGNQETSVNDEEEDHEHDHHEDDGDHDQDFEEGNGTGAEEELDHEAEATGEN